MSMDDSARRTQGTRVDVDPRWQAGEDTCTDITRRFVPDEDDPTVRASPEFTEALLNQHGGYRDHRVSSAVKPRPTKEARSRVRATSPDETPTTPPSGDSRWADASISVRLESLLSDDPALASVVAGLRAGDRASGELVSPASSSRSHHARNDEHTVVDGWANRPSRDRREDSQAGAPPEVAFDEATDVDPAFSSDWLPRAPRVPSEFARTGPRSAIIESPRRRRSRERPLHLLKAVVAGALLTGLPFLVGRLHYDPAFRARVTSAVMPLWHDASARLAELSRRVQARRAAPPRPSPTQALPAREAPRVSTLAATPATGTAQAAPEAPEDPAMRVYRIEELPLERCDGPRCDEAPKKERSSRRAR